MKKKVKSFYAAFITSIIILVVSYPAEAGFLDELKSKAESAATSMVHKSINKVEHPESSPSSNATSGTHYSSSNSTTQSPVKNNSADAGTTSSHYFSVNASEPDILGLKIGMTRKQSHKILESRGYKFSPVSSHDYDGHAYLSITSNLGRRKLATTVRSESAKKGNIEKSGMDEFVSLQYSLPPDPERLIEINRSIRYASQHGEVTGPDTESFNKSIKKKYGDPTILIKGSAVTPGSPSRETWIYGKNGKLFRPKNKPSAGKIIRLPTMDLCSKVNEADITSSTYVSEVSLSQNGKLMIGTRPYKDPANYFKIASCSEVMRAQVGDDGGKVASISFTLIGNGLAYKDYEKTLAYATKEIKKDNVQAAKEVQHHSAPAL